MQGYPSGMGQIGGGLESQMQQVQVKAPDIFDELRSAQNRFREACYAFQKAAQDRDQAAAKLQGISEKANSFIQAALQDPTVPQEEAPANGRY